MNSISKSFFLSLSTSLIFSAFSAEELKLNKGVMVNLGILSVIAELPNACRPKEYTSEMGRCESFNTTIDANSGTLEVNDINFASGNGIFKLLKMPNPEKKNEIEPLILRLRRKFEDTETFKKLDLYSKMGPKTKKDFWQYRDLDVRNFALKTDQITRVTKDGTTFLVAPIHFSVFMNVPTAGFAAGITFNVLGYVYVLESGNLKTVVAPETEKTFANHLEAVWFDENNWYENLGSYWSGESENEVANLLEFVVEPAIKAAQLPWKELMIPSTPTTQLEKLK